MENGKLVPVFRKTWFDFSCEAGQTSEVIVADKIDTTGYGAGQLVVRLYEVSSFASATATFRVSMRSMSIAPDELQTDFVYPFDLTSVDLTQADTAPAMKFQTYGSAGPNARMFVSLIQGANTGRVKIAIGVDLLMRWI